MSESALHLLEHTFDLYKHIRWKHSRLSNNINSIYEPRNSFLSSALQLQNTDTQNISFHLTHLCSIIHISIPPLAQTTCPVHHAASGRQSIAMMPATSCA